MPAWQIFIPENALSSEDKLEIGKRATAIYSENFDLNMPRFYTTVYFHEHKPGAFVIGGETRENYAQVSILHIARSHEQVAEYLGIGLQDLNEAFMKMAHEVLDPFIADRGYELELFVQQSDRELWRIDGMSPPPPWSDAERQWAKDNHSSPFVAAELQEK
ncbi:MAG: tautomerase family protein [Sporichthyaceae bacterium]